MSKKLPKVLIADSISRRAIQIFQNRGVDVDIRTGISKKELVKIIGNFDGLAVRSETKVTPEVLAAAKNEYH